MGKNIYLNESQIAEISDLKTEQPIENDDFKNEEQTNTRESQPINGDKNIENLTCKNCLIASLGFICLTVIIFCCIYAPSRSPPVCNFFGCEI